MHENASRISSSKTKESLLASKVSLSKHHVVGLLNCQLL